MTTSRRRRAGNNDDDVLLLLLLFCKRWEENVVIKTPSELRMSSTIETFASVSSVVCITIRISRRAVFAAVTTIDRLPADQWKKCVCAPAQAAQVGSPFTGRQVGGLLGVG